MDKTAFRSLTYGMYLVSSLRDGKPVGCVANTFTQVTSSPAQASIALNKDNFTTQGVRETGAFEVTVLDQSASMELIGAFGFHSSADTDKFSGFTTETSAQGIPYVAEQVCARFSVKVEQEIDLGSHVLFIGSVADAASLGGEEPMTYAYYHQVKGGKTPPKAPSFNEDAPAKKKNRTLRQVVHSHGVARFAVISNTSTSFQKTSSARYAEWVGTCLSV